MFDESILPEWFNISEFNDFLTQQEHLGEEVSVQTRIKLARAARRTAKRRAFLRKARAKRRKTGVQLKKRAYREVRSALRKRLFSGDIRKASYAQRARIDATINRRKQFVNKLVTQIMPKVVKKENQRIKNINKPKGIKESFIFEQDINPKNDRVAARIRKQKQRAKEKEIRETDPAQMAMVVRDQQGNLIIVDKDSYETDKHTPIVKPQDMSYSVALRISQDPSFKNTPTSERILGTRVGSEQEAQAAQQQSAGGSAPQPIAQQQQQLNLPGGQPIQDTTEIDASNAKWVTTTAINLMKGMDIKAQVKAGMLTPEQANQFMFSTNMQEFGNMMVEKIAKEFTSTTGRSINEYKMIPVPREEMPVSELWQKFGSMNNFPKTDIAFIHNCVSGKGDGSNCQSFGLDPDEQIIKINIKYGNSHLIDGKMNGDLRALFETVNQRIQEHLHGGYGSLLGDEATLSEADRKQFEIFHRQILDFKRFLDESVGMMPLRYGNNMLYNRATVSADEIIEDYSAKIEKIKIEVYKRLHDIFSNNRVAMKLFYHEVLSGKLKFDNSMGTSNYLLAIDDTTNEVKLSKINEALIDEMIDTEKMTLDISFKCDHCGTMYEEAAWQKTIDHFAIENNIPPEIDSMRMCGRTTVVPQKENYFRNSSLKVLFETDTTSEREETHPSDEFLIMYYKNYLSEIQQASASAKNQDARIGLFFNLFTTSPIGVRTNPIHIFDLIEKRDGIKITNITINGKQKFLKVMAHPVFDSDTIPEIDDMSESYSFAKRFVAEYWVKKNGERDYKKEYKKYQGKEEQRKNRSKRNLARRKLSKLGRVRKGDGKDVDHKDGNPKNNSTDNLGVTSKSYNRSKK
jgi:hypothetical protein